MSRRSVVYTMKDKKEVINLTVEESRSVSGIEQYGRNFCVKSIIKLWNGSDQRIWWAKSGIDLPDGPNPISFVAAHAKLIIMVNINEPEPTINSLQKLHTNNIKDSRYALINEWVSVAVTLN